MSYEQFPTHLGGELANLEWADLAPLEIVRATVGSAVKASHLISLAEAQIAAAAELGREDDRAEYENARQILIQIGHPVLKHTGQHARQTE